MSRSTTPQRPRLRRALTTVALGALVFAGAAAPASAAKSKSAVLGVKGLYGQYGTGWGKPHPKVFFNGGAPSGAARSVKWSHWGSATATGVGRAAQYRPEGGYYSKPVTIKLQAFRLGTCPGKPGKRAYTRMIAKEQTRPGGPYGDWFPWTLDLCDFDATAADCPSAPAGTLGGWTANKLTQFDTDCATATDLALGVGTIVPEGQADYGITDFRFERNGFVCKGYSIGYDYNIPWSCSRGSAVVAFTQE